MPKKNKEQEELERFYQEVAEVLGDHEESFVPVRDFIEGRCWLMFFYS